MRRWSLVVLLSLPAAVLAQSPAPVAPASAEPVGIQFIDLNEMLIHGARVRPQTKRFEQRTRPEFVPLVNLKRNFLGKLHASRHAR